MNSRSIISFFILFTHACLSAQSLGLGVTIQPFVYKNYNKSDWNNRPSSYPVNPSGFNGNAFGLTFSANLTENAGLKTELLYSSQTQSHKLSIIGDTTYNDGKNYYGANTSVKFNIVKLPVSLFGRVELGYESGLYFTLFGGPQISFVSSYKQEYLQYNFDPLGSGFDKNFIFNTIERTPNHQEQYIWDYNLDPDDYRHIISETDFFFNQILLGVVGGVEIQKTINDKILIGLGMKFDYDFTNSEKYPELRFPGTRWVW